MVNRHHTLDCLELHVPGEKKTLHAYTLGPVDRGRHEGADPRGPAAGHFQLDEDAVDEAFKELTDAEDQDEESAEVLVRRGSRVDVVFANPARTQAVCDDIIDYFYSTIDPLGMKAQVVVFDRAACVAYHEHTCWSSGTRRGIRWMWHG